MDISGISEFDYDKDDMRISDSEGVDWNGKELKLLDGERNNGAVFARIVLETSKQHLCRNPDSSSMSGINGVKSMGTVGGSVSAEKDEDGNAEITAEAHVSATSDDGSTSVKASGEATVDNQGNCSGKIEVSLECEF